MTLLPFGLDGVMSPAKFEAMDEKLGYRVVFQEVDPCPNDAEGCVVCRAAGRTAGKHPRPIARVDFDDVLVARDDGLPFTLPHALRTTPLTIDGLSEGNDFAVRGRFLQVAAHVPRRAPLRVRYQAYREDYVHMQHVHADFAGAGRRVENSLNLRFANLEQGLFAASIPQSAAGYRLKPGDRFILPDITMPFPMSVSRDRDNLRARHQFVTGVSRAYGLNASGNREVELQAAWDPEKRRFTLEGDYDKAVILYDAHPSYAVYLDQGEARAPMSGQYHKLALLIREEVSR